MARAKRKVSPMVAPPREEEEDEDEQELEDNPSTALKFDQSLIGRPGKPIAIAELLKRLKALYAELTALDQEECPRQDVERIAAELAHTNVLGHKDNGVKAWATCCIVEVLRLTAPNAPFKSSQLKEIFEVVVTAVIPAFRDANDPYRDQHASILLSLDEVKSISLLPSIPASDSLVARLFSNTFDLLGAQRGRDGVDTLPKNVEFHLTGILVTVVDEGQTLPVEVVELILAQFLRIEYGLKGMGRMNGKDHTTTGRPALRDYPTAYQVAKSICNQAPERMSRAISQYFSSVIVDASNSGSRAKASKPTSKKRRRDEDSGSEDEGVAAGPSEQEMKELAKAHKLLCELWRSAPEAIQNVIPQLDAELSTENIEIRLLATVTTGELVSGIGAAGLPDAPALDPQAYPGQSVDGGSAAVRSFDILTKPASPQDFSRAHPSAYTQFLKRSNDKAPQIRAAFATAVGRILITSAGGIGLDHDAKTDLLQQFAEMLQDNDEKVRLAAVQVVSRSSYDEIIRTFGQSGPVTQNSTVLACIADRIKDKKISVRHEAIRFMANLWGTASGAIVEGNDYVKTLLGSIPTRILESVFVNEADLNRQVTLVLFEALLPLGFPPIKGEGKEKANSSQRVKDSQASQGSAPAKIDVDAIRVQRILHLVAGLGDRAKHAFFALQKRQAILAERVEAFLKGCEAFNGGSDKPANQDAKGHLGKFIDSFAGMAPDIMTASEHLWKFAKKNDRRSYSLIRFMISPESDYKKVVNSIREFKRRWEDSTGNPQQLLQTLIPLLYQSSVVIYSRSHVPAILNCSRLNTDDLGSTAHELLKEISNNHPEVFKAHVRTMCKSLTENAPSSSAKLDDGILQTLKACAGFAQKYPGEMPQDRDLLKALMKFALYSDSPKAAKYAVSVLVANEDKRDMYVKELAGKCINDFSLKSPGSLSKLAALSQLMLLAAPILEEEQDTVTTIAIQDVLLADSTADPMDDDENWREDIDSETEVNIWALKILVNQQRGIAENSSVDEASLKAKAEPVFKLLQKIINEEGRVGQGLEPHYRRSRIRLAAGVHLLKLASANKHFDQLISPPQFNKLALLVQDEVSEVRSGFVAYLKKYLGQNRLPSRYYTIAFLLAYEPTLHTKDATVSWLRARSAAAGKNKDNAMELAFARFLSVLAHHPDFSTEPEHAREWVDYILFYLRVVADRNALPLIYHVAQRVKAVRDGIDDASSDNLYFLSDLAQAIIREYAELNGWQLQAYEGKVPMPTGIFARMPSHKLGQEIADKNFVTEEIVDDLDDYIRSSLKSKKRKPERDTERKNKKVKMNGTKLTNIKAARTPRKGRAADDSSPVGPSAERRRSGRQSNAKSYAGMDDSDNEDEEMEDASSEGVNEAGVEHSTDSQEDDGDKENVDDEADDSTNAVAKAAGTKKTVAPSRKRRR